MAVGPFFLNESNGRYKLIYRLNLLTKNMEGNGFARTFVCSVIICFGKTSVGKMIYVKKNTEKIEVCN